MTHILTRFLIVIVGIAGAATVLLIAAIPVHAAAPARPAHWAAIQAVEREQEQVVRAVCRGPAWDNYPAGLPGNPTDDIRCQSIAGLSLVCTDLAISTGIYRHMIRSGETTFDRLKSSIENSPHSSTQESQALVLLRALPPGMHGGPLIRTVYAQCMSVIPKAARRVP